MSAATPTVTGSRWQRIRDGLTPAEWRRAGVLFFFIALLHVIGFGLLFGFVVPAHLDLGSNGIFGIGVGITAYTLGMRHALTPITSARSTTRPASS